MKLHHRSRDITGLRMGMMTATKPLGSDGKKTLWYITCDCGQTRILPASEFLKGSTKSCGCSTKKFMSAAMTTHGMSRHPAFHVWRGMLDRCRLPTHQAWARYGGRGITVCERWKKFAAFWEDMGETYQKGLDLDRIDNMQGYSPENCRWTDRKTNARNTRAGVVIDTPLGAMRLWEAAEVSGVGKTTLAYRRDAGWPAHRMFDKPDPTNRLSSIS